MTADHVSKWDDETPAEVIDAARLLLEWAGPMTAWSVMGIGVSDHGEIQERLSQQLAINCNLRTEVEQLRRDLEKARQPMVCYMQCEKHRGLPWSYTYFTNATAVGSFKTICPICEPPPT